MRCQNIIRVLSLINSLNRRYYPQLPDERKLDLINILIISIERLWLLKDGRFIKLNQSAMNLSDLNLNGNSSYSKNINIMKTKNFINKNTSILLGKDIENEAHNDDTYCSLIIHVLENDTNVHNHIVKIDILVNTDVHFNNSFILTHGLRPIKTDGINRIEINDRLFNEKVQFEDYDISTQKLKLDIVENNINFQGIVRIEALGCAFAIEALISCLQNEKDSLTPLYDIAEKKLLSFCEMIIKIAAKEYKVSLNEKDVPHFQLQWNHAVKASVIASAVNAYQFDLNFD